MNINGLEILCENLVEYEDIISLEELLEECDSEEGCKIISNALEYLGA